MTHNSGIWLDKKKAVVVHLKDKNATTVTIDSEIETYHPKGGSRSKTVYGPSMAIKESAYVDREKKQSKKFFEKIVKELSNSNNIYICGPAEMKNHFKKHIDGLSHFKPSITAIESKDSMTDNQIIAEVKTAFVEVS